MMSELNVESNTKKKDLQFTLVFMSVVHNHNNYSKQYSFGSQCYK